MHNILNDVLLAVTGHFGALSEQLNTTFGSLGTFVTNAPKVLLWPGYLLVLEGALFQALSTIINKKQITKKAPPDVVPAVTFLDSGLLLLASALLFDPPNIQSVFDMS